MNKNSIVTACTLASIGSILVGFALMLAALGPERTSNWGKVATGFTPQAILVAGGLLALAICGSFGRGAGGSD